MRAHAIGKRVFSCKYLFGGKAMGRLSILDYSWRDRRRKEDWQLSEVPTLARVRRQPPRVRAVEVSRVTKLSEHRTRVQFVGDLADFSLAGPVGHIKVYFPHPHQNGIDFAALAMPRGSRPPSAPIARTFTPRKFDSTAGTLDVDFFVHGEGPASSFAQSALNGQQIAISGPSRPHLLQPNLWQLLVGDESAIPAIETILEALPADARGSVVLEINDLVDRPNLVAPEGVEVICVIHNPQLSHCAEMLATIKDLAIPAVPIQVFVAAESVGIRALRRELLSRDLQIEQITTRGYWRFGEAGHPDSDMGED